ncbi:MAG: alpha/beta hydrolase [Planctomycetes bacterium]|nr:alpha/beta hydrolase [Planctomycetota bacterium]
MTSPFLRVSTIAILLAFVGCSSPGRHTAGHGKVSTDGPEIGSVRAEDGVRIAYSSEGHGEPAIVFIHGWTCDRTHWRFQVPEFRKSHRVIAIDLPGHGASGADRNAWSIDGLGSDVAAVVRGLKLDQVVLVGHSMGGPVALAAAPRLRGILRGIVAVDSVHNVEFTMPAETSDRFVKRFEHDFEGAWKRFMSGFFADPGSEILKSILEKAGGVDRRAAIELLADYNRFDWKSALAAAGVPVRAINAAKPFRTEVKINRKYGDFDAVLISDVGHFLMLEKPVDFNRHLRMMIEQLRENQGTR